LVLLRDPPPANPEAGTIEIRRLARITFAIVLGAPL
jgi:hypothetical protein